MFSCGEERPWAAVGMDLFMEKPVNRDKLRAMLDLLESDSWQRNSTADSAQLPSTVFADNERCASLGSFSGGLDNKVGAAVQHVSTCCTAAISQGPLTAGHPELPIRAAVVILLQAAV